MAEEWKPVNGFEGHYVVSNLGNVKSLKSGGMILKSHVNKGYEYVHLCKNSKHYNAKVHRLVAKAYIPSHENACEVNHKDGNKLNNRVENLEWVTPSENMKHARMLGLNRAGRNNAFTSKAVDMISPDGSIIQTFPSTMEAERQTGIRRANIQGCCAGRYGCKTAGGFRWQYHEDCMESYRREVLPE